MGLIWIACVALWAVAEATIFFIVPDVLLTLAAIRFGFRAGLRLAVIAAASASLAGLGLWFWARSDVEAARQLMLWVPAVGPDLLARAQREVQGNWPIHLFIGAITGVPYKLYAVEVGALGINPLFFVLVSFGARLARFALTIGLVTLGREILAKAGKPNWIYAAWALSWIVVYAVYFTTRAMA